MKKIEFRQCGKSFTVAIDGCEVGRLIWLGMYEPKTYMPDEKMAQYLSDTLAGTHSYWRKKAETLVTWSAAICERHPARWTVVCDIGKLVLSVKDNH